MASMSEPNSEMSHWSVLSRVSHQLRTPMNSIAGLTELLLDTDLSSEQRRSIERIQISAESLLTLVNDILDVTRLRTNRVELENIPFDLAALVESTVRLLGVRAYERRIGLSATIDPDVPRMVQGDPSRLRQILMNLIGNAIKFTHEGRVTVDVIPAGMRNGDVIVQFAVRDTGIGIPSDRIEAIFDEFTQADTERTREYGGTGLGLPIARRLAELMGGSLTATSLEGTGSEFLCRIAVAPLAEEEPEADAAVHLDLSATRVLVVDDNAASAESVVSALAGTGMAPEAVARPQDAMAALQAASASGRPYHLIILDGWIGGKDGFELARAIRSDGKLRETRILMLTGAARRGDGQRCRSIGVAAYFAKPLTDDDLVNAVSATLLTRPGDGLVTRHSVEEGRRRLRILLADDNEVNRQVATAILQKRGHLVDAVENGRLAVVAAGRSAYDVIVMDVEMPELDGPGATAELRSMPGSADVPVIAMTAHVEFEREGQFRAAGMDAYIAKPFRPHELVRMVESLGVATPAARLGGPSAPVTDPVNLAEFRRVLREAGIEETVDRILGVFAEDAPVRMAVLEGAVAGGQGGEIRMAAHAYKSAAATIRAENLAELLSQIEHAGSAGDVHHAAELIGQVRNESDSVLSYLAVPAVP
jgi:CheY-like chemotaxis protein/HPt (histidine-containing phosphotransfer) domain-containing protein